MNEIVNIQDSSKIYFTSDSHFGHKNIIKYCNRPFNITWEHDEALIKNWNEKVPEDGLVFHLGDFGFGRKAYLQSIKDRLNGKIVLVIGNHDWKNIIKQKIEGFDMIVQQLNLKIRNQGIILNHYPMLCYSGVYRSTPVWQLFGHVHSGPLSNQGLDHSRLDMLYSTQYDVGVDNNNFTPISYDEVAEKIYIQGLEHSEKF